MKDTIVWILSKIVVGEQLHEEERRVLDEWIALSPHNKAVYLEITDPASLEKELSVLQGLDRKLLWKRIRKAIQGSSAILIW